MYDRRFGVTVRLGTSCVLWTDERCCLYTTMSLRCGRRLASDRAAASPKAQRAWEKMGKREDVVGAAAVVCVTRRLANQTKRLVTKRYAISNEQGRIDPAVQYSQIPLPQTLSPVKPRITTRSLFSV